MKSEHITGTSRSRPSGALRLAFKLPMHLYRLNLGWLLGHRVLLLTHRGRKSGRVRRTALEVIRHDAATGESVVVSAWGERSDWYRNIRADPAMEIRTAGRRFAPSQRFLSLEETYAEMTEYEKRHPRLAGGLSGWLGLPLDGTEGARRRFSDSVRMVAFRPEKGGAMKSKTVENLSVALMGAFAGGCLFVSTVLVPAWRKMDPEEVLEWFARNELRSGLTLATLEAGGALTAIMSFLRATREGSDGCLQWALSGVCMLATLAQLPLYFAGINRAMVDKEIPLHQVGTQLESWSRWLWARTKLSDPATSPSRPGPTTTRS